MNVTVGTSPVKLPIGSDQTPLIQNLGPGAVYLDSDSAVDEDSGFKLDVDEKVQFQYDMNSGGGDLYLVSDQADTDVRYIIVG